MSVLEVKSRVWFYKKMYPGKEKDIANILGLRGLEVSSYTIDSRLCQPGGCFFALPGRQTDGTQFLSEVAGLGGVAAIVPKSYQGPDFGLRICRVADVKLMMRQVAALVYSKRRTCVIGVTGSVGKTTIKEFTATVLGGVYRSPGSYNSQLTLPLCVLNCPEDAKLAVLEYGMSRKGEMQKLVDLAPPNIGIVGPIAYSHAESFDSLNEIAQEKLKLVQDVRLKVVHSSTGADGLIYDRESMPFRLPFDAPHLVENAKAAVCVARFLGLCDDQIQAGLDKIQIVERRGTITEYEGVTYYNDSYNANVTSFKAALAACPKKKRQIAVVGSMGELGKFSQSCHRQLGDMLKEIDEVLCIGKECQLICEMLGAKAKYFDEFDALKLKLQSMVQEGDVVLIKGSNVHQLWRLIP